MISWDEKFLDDNVTYWSEFRLVFLTLTGTVIEALRIPFPSKVLTTLVTQAAIESSPDLTTHSGLSGASYGESIPVNPMKIKLANKISVRIYQYANQIA